MQRHFSVRSSMASKMNHARLEHPTVRDHQKRTSVDREATLRRRGLDKFPEASQRAAMLGAILLTLFLPLMLLILGALRGLSVVVLGPLCAALGVNLGAEPIMASLTERLVPALGGLVIASTPLFVLGAIFERLMEITDAAQALAQAIISHLGTGPAILTIVLSCAILTLGGVSVRCGGTRGNSVMLEFTSFKRIGVHQRHRCP